MSYFAFLLPLFALLGLFQGPAPAYKDLTPAQFSEAMRRPGVLLLDVRRPDEFAGGHLPGAVNIDVTAPDFAQRVAALDKTRPTYVYCRSGARSTRAANQLTQAGFVHISNLIGGVLEWPEKLVR